MEDIYYLIFGFGLIVFTIIGILVFLLINKNEQLNLSKEVIANIKRSFEDLDQQAKLIVKTDLELNKAQEESDKRLSGLEALHKISRLISTTLDEDEIFHRLNESLISELDFEENLILIYDESKNLQERVHKGFKDDVIDDIINNLKKDTPLIKACEEGKTFSSVNSPQQKKDVITDLFNVEHFVLSPIITQNGTIGFFFVGNRSNISPMTEGDEELISILANQIGQSLENARLFEQVYRSSQILESKVQDRTQQLATALKEVQNISKTKSEFISAVSHELRTPLTSIKGYAAILMNGKLGDIPNSVKERLEKINIHTDNLVKLINNLLDISRIESGRVSMAMGRCHFPQLIDNVHDLLTPQLKEKNIQLTIDIDSKITEMILDGSQIERVFINLIGNAIKFTPNNGSISIRAKLDNNLVTVEISDTGIGIKKEDVDKLFDEFYRVENQINQNVKGTGLGLPLAKKIIEAHLGKMWVTSKLNEGTTFHFTLLTQPPTEHDKNENKSQ